MIHTKGAALLRKDQSRRLKYQEQQRLNQKCTSFVDTKKSFGTFGLSEGQLKSFTSKLIK